MTDSRETLAQFLHGALATKRERLCGFATKAKTQDKFLAELFHGFGEYVAASVVVADLPERAWSSPALVFLGSGVFGESFASLREAWENVDRQQGALAISTDGRFGVWCDHYEFDERVCMALSPGDG